MDAPPLNFVLRCQFSVKCANSVPSVSDTKFSNTKFSLPSSSSCGGLKLRSGITTARAQSRRRWPNWRFLLEQWGNFATTPWSSIFLLLWRTETEVGHHHREGPEQKQALEL
ncbi:hypothetical protein ZWY2020_054346 [Hordeum vulgare]|nr:hypothetical protein ZWY2020_054346 [Hordeum vulgare]